MSVKYPHVTVPLSVGGGNIYAIGGRVIGELRRAGVSSTELDQFAKELRETGSYDEALQCVMHWVETE